MPSSSNSSASTDHNTPQQKALQSKDNHEEAPLAVITGGSGFLGSYLCKILAEQGWRVLALSRSGESSKALPFSHHALEHRSLDVLDLNAFEEACQGAQALYHLAGRVSRDPKDDGALHELHVKGTKHFVTVAEKLAIPHLVYLSTSGVAGVSKTTVLADETTPYARDLIGNWAYYQSKLYAEEEVYRAIDQGLPIKIARPSLLLGPGDPSGQSHEDLLLFLSGQLKAVPPGGLNAVDVRDVANFLPILAEKGEVGIPYMLGGTNLSARSFINQIAQITSRQPPLLDLPQQLVKKAMSPLKWLSSISLLGGIDPQTFEMACHYWYIDSEKAHDLGFKTRPLSSTLLEALKDLKARGFYFD